MADPLFDAAAREQRRRRALSRTPRPFLAERIVEDWLERLAPVQRRFVQALVTGCPPALHARLSGVAGDVRYADTVDGLAAEEEGSLDLILVMGELDARDELPLLLRIIASRLAPGGLLAGAIVGGQSLPALRAAIHAAGEAEGVFAARAHPMVEPGAFAGLLGAAGLADPVVDIERLRLRYRSFGKLVADLRDHAGTNMLAARPRAGLKRAQLAAATAAFAALADKGATEERIELLHYGAWSPVGNNRP
ncbi:SAM-dependent methyltransferase [Sphingomonas sp. LHG3406-1]|uniref:SAM-dependent methyltransferase n=1 Tax=Sphingomonas sp. LHG3406-1 TaxID=2804617 RepID=UPI002601FDD6|nr:SAM-dependent methyltransferase [Sphingomonas sp. LHG3406-1]